MKTLESNSVKYGLLTTLALIAYFLLMKVFGLAHNYNLRFFNAVIMFTGIYLSISSYKKSQKPHRFDYLQGLGEGVFTSLVTAISFTAFLVIYLLIDQPFMREVSRQELWGHHIHIMGVATLIFIEALSSGALFSFICMQYLKQNVLSEVEDKIKQENQKKALQN